MPFALDTDALPPWGPMCPVDGTVSAIGSRTSILLLRQAFYGDNRFEDFVQHTGISEATVAKRLQELVDVGVFRKRPYQDPGSRVRDEYVLTDAGNELLPVILGLFEWGRRHLGESDSRLDLLGPDGRPVRLSVRSATDEELSVDDIRVHQASPIDDL